MHKGISLTVEGKTVHAVLNDSRTADLLYRKLPITIELSRWGDEYYGDCGIEVKAEAGARVDMAVGELAVWPQGSALCIFFGPTPASTGSAPRAVSPVNPIGTIEGDVLFLKKLGGSVTAEVKKRE
jgi:hypothetical protein